MNRSQSMAKVLSLLVATSLLVGAAGCGGRGGPAVEGELRGTITVSGAWALYPLMVQWAESFQDLHPRVRIDVSAGGAGKGMSDALGGAVDIGMVSRAITPEEEARGAFWVACAIDAVFPAVNERNPVLEDLRRQGVTQAIFEGIYATGEITTWGQVVGRPEITSPIHIYTRSDACGAAEVWAKYLGGRAQEDLLGIAVFGDPGLLDAVIKDPMGLGYNNLNYMFDMETGKPVAGSVAVYIDVNANGRADPEEVYDTKEQAVAVIASGVYPSPPARPLDLVTRGKPTGLTLAFIEWILTEGQRYVDEVGYIELGPQQLEEQLTKLRGE